MRYRIGANHKAAVVTMVEHKSGSGVIAKVTNKTSEFDSSAIVDKLKPMAVRVKTLTIDTAKSFRGIPILMNSFKAQPNLPDHLPIVSVAAIRI